MSGFNPRSPGRGVGRQPKRGGKKTPRQRKRERIKTHFPVHRRGERFIDGRKVYLYYCEACKATTTVGKLREMKCPKAPPEELEGRSADDVVA